MAKQTILWTALPNGYSKDRRSLRISLLVTPRLEPDADPRLKAFPDFVDWPATLAQSRFEVHFGAGPGVPIKGNQTAGRTRIDDRLGLPDPTIWQALFPPKTLVSGYQWRDLSKHEVLSFPAADLDNKIRDLYSDLASSALDQLPTASTFLNDPKWKELIDAVRDHDQRYTERNSGIRNTARQFSEFKHEPALFKRRDLQTNLARFELFHTPPSPSRTERYWDAKPNSARSSAEWLGYEQTPLPKPEDFKDEIDFHRMVSAMNQYPTLLRSLGLVVDLLVARDELNPSPKALLWVRVELPPETPGVTRPEHDASPRTQALLDGTRFQSVSPTAAPGPGDFRISDGLLTLDPKTFKLLQADVDGGTSKLMNFARSLLILREKQEQQLDPVTKKKREIGAPAIRNAGLMLVHDGRGDKLKSILKRQDGFNSDAMKIQQGVASPPKPPEMFAEDLVRGYRIDIWDDVSGEWHSLCQRTARYNIADGKVIIDVPAEEGTVRLAATTSPNKNSNPEIIWLHEALVSWAGWSLCAPAPGKTIHHRTKKKDEKGNEVIVHEDPVGEPEAEVPPELRLRSTFKALSGTLPRLRYGRGYWLRARAVDLAGNSLLPKEEDYGPDKPPDNPPRYFRYEPILAPALALFKSPPDPTETPAEGESMELMAVRSFNDTPALNAVTSSQRARRMVVPSRTTQREAEHHGMLDRAGIVDPTFFATLAAQDNSLLQETVSAVPPEGGDPVKTEYSVMSDGDSLPYLPDPLAVEIAARIFDHPTFPAQQIIKIPFYPDTEWPEALPFKIEIYEDPDDTPHYDADTRTLLIPLPKAARATLRLSVRPDRKALNILGVWNWLTDAQKTKTVVINGQSTTLERLARDGQHWMLTPWRNIELVHAVQRPLITPELTMLEVDRDANKTYGRPRFTATCSIPSTDRLDLRANWNEPFDDGPDKALGNRARVDHAFSVKITDAKSYAGLHDYNSGAAPNLINVPGNALGIRDQIVKGVKLHEFHDTRYRRIEYWLEGTTKFREFLSSNYLLDEDSKPTEDHIKVVGPKKLTWVRCSASPPAPEVLYVVPTFGWVRSADGATSKSWRRGGGLRVYLNRPWNVSGYGEMLAVVLPGANVDDPNVDPKQRPLKDFVTQWGNDPIWLSPYVPGVAPKPANFPLARTKPDPDGKWLPSFAPPEEADQRPGPFLTTGRVLPELRKGPPESKVDIAPHDVFYDEERQLWYCDIEVTWGAAYFPFIRLALARYQPCALEDDKGQCHLSNVVLADFMPLVPDRWLNVTHTRDPRTRNVRVFGHTYSDSSGNQEARNSLSASFITPDGVVDVKPVDVAASSVVEVWVEYFDPTLGEDFGWKRESGAIVINSLAEPPADPRLAANTAIARARVRAKDLLIHREFEALIDEDLIDHVFIMPTLWQGSVTLPVVPASGADRRYRLAIAEYEEYLVDDDARNPDENAYDRFLKSKDRRLVFIEYVEL